MRKATFAKLSLTAAVGLGTLLGQATTAQAGPPPGPGFEISTPTTKPDPHPNPGPQLPADIVIADQEPDPDPPFDPDLPIATPEGDDCHELQVNCDKVPPPQDPEPECPELVLCDEITDAGCTWTHGCPEDPEPECNPIALCDEITSDPGCNVTHGDCGGGDEGTDDGDEGTDDGDEGTTGGSTDDGGTGGGTLPKTGAEMATWAIAGLGLTGVGAALRKLGKRAA